METTTAKSEKYETLTEARDRAIELSKNLVKTFFIIESGGFFHIDESSFTRTWERMIGEFSNGKQVY